MKCTDVEHDGAHGREAGMGNGNGGPGQETAGAWLSSEPLAKQSQHENREECSQALGPAIKHSISSQSPPPGEKGWNCIEGEIVLLSS